MAKNSVPFVEKLLGTVPRRHVQEIGRGYLRLGSAVIDVPHASLVERLSKSDSPEFRAYFARYLLDMLGLTAAQLAAPQSPTTAEEMKAAAATATSAKKAA
jgi:hypothetical protein